jgi:hypothetical protein
MRGVLKTGLDREKHRFNDIRQGPDGYLYALPKGRAYFSGWWWSEFLLLFPIDGQGNNSTFYDQLLLKTEISIIFVNIHT